MKTETFRYVVAYSEDFVTADDHEIHTNFQSAINELNNNEDPSEFTILRAPDEYSDYDHVYENGEWVKYC